MSRNKKIDDKKIDEIMAGRGGKPDFVCKCGAYGWGDNKGDCVFCKVAARIKKEKGLTTDAENP